VRCRRGAITSRVIDAPPHARNHRPMFNRKEPRMSIFESPRFLRNVLIVDAASGAASSLLHLLGAGALAGLLGIPHGVLVTSGALLLLFVAAASYVALCDPIPRPLVSMLIAANWAWVIASAALFYLDASTLTQLGKAYVIVQAVAVAALAELEWMGLRRAPRVGWA
jgi:hypothetical protein